MLSKKESKGFTLVEVLVASLILFSVLATVSMVYRGAISSSTKATQHLKINSVIQALITHIEHEVNLNSKTDNNAIEYEGVMNGVSYKWKGKVAKFESAPQRFDLDSGNIVTPPKKFKLWDIDLFLEYKSTKKQFNFSQIGWNDA